MYHILYICTVTYFSFGLIYGNECEKKYITDMGCRVFQTDSENQCQTYLLANGGGGNFVFYTKPLIIKQKWKLTIGLNKKHSGSSSTQITQNLFTVTISNPNRVDEWNTVIIKRGIAQKALCIFNCNFNTYYLEVNGQKTGTYLNEIEAGNEIRVKTESSFWSYTCDPGLYQPSPAVVPKQPVIVPLKPKILTTAPLIPTQPTTAHVLPNQYACGEKDEKQTGCPIYKQESQIQCNIYLRTIDEVRNFVFYIKPFIKGNFSTKLAKRSLNDYNNPDIIHGLFTIILNKANIWHKIQIIRGEVTKQGCKQHCMYQTYSLEINDEEISIHTDEIETGNEILIETSLASLMSLTCDPRQFQSTTQSTKVSQVQSHSTSPSSLLPIEATHTATFLPIWQLVIIAGVSLLVILAIVVILVLRHKRGKQDPRLIQPTDNHTGISRHVSDNSLYESYVGAGNRGLEGHITNDDNIYEEIDPQGSSNSNSATNSTTDSTANCVTYSGSSSSAKQRRGSSHISENSLYMGFK